MTLRDKASIVLILFSFCTAQAVAEDDGGGPVLKGKYRVSANGACTESFRFSDRPWNQPLGNSLVYQETFSAIMTIDGRGHAIEENVRGMTMFDGPWFPGPPPGSAVGGFDGTCSFDYTMTGDLSFTMAGQCSGTLTDGPSASARYSVTGIQLDGQISVDGNLIMLTGATPTRQHIHLSNDYDVDRLCVASSVLMRSTKK